MMDILLSAPGFWLAAAVVFGVIESLTMGLVTIWFAGGALVALLAAILDASIPIQIGLFLVVSIVLLVGTRKIFIDKLKTGQEKTNVEALIGKVGTAVTDVDHLSAGIVNLSGQEWSAICEGEYKIAAGDKVKVDKIEGVKLIVAPFEE
ncbi:MAG: NfeD family protein [Clostridia bacterium]|nr:NfeD family protein [Clostridia bacterium]